MQWLLFSSIMLLAFVQGVWESSYAQDAYKSDSHRNYAFHFVRENSMCAFCSNM